MLLNPVMIQIVSENDAPLFRNLKIIGKAYSGLSNKEIDYMTNKLKSLIMTR